jgi:DNA-binding NarL/FixJ family response regulator
MYWFDERWSGEIAEAESASRDCLRVLVACEGRLVAEAMMLSLECDLQLRPIGYALDGWEALAFTASLAPDVVVLGPRLPGLNPVEFSRLAHELFPQLVLIMLCEQLVPADVRAAFEVGVADCFPVTRSVDELLLTITSARARPSTARRPALTLVPTERVDACA